MRLLWLGTIHNANGLKNSAAASPAAAKWSTGLLGALQDSGHEILCISHYHLPAWPRGSLYSRYEGQVSERFDTVGIDTWNLPVMREFDLGRKYRKLVIEAIRSSHFDAVLTYNLTAWNLKAAGAAKASGLPWISIMLDFANPGDNLEAHDRVARNADGHVFLSYWAYKTSKLLPKLHLDGGVESNSSMHIRCSYGEFVRPSLVYAGLINKTSGSEFLAAALRQVKSRDVEFLIFGKGRCRKLENAAAEDTRIKLKGYVSVNELETACQFATAFLCPRPDDVENNSMIFPSKILEYIKYQRPIICTPNRGMDPRYWDVLNFVTHQAPELYAEEIDRVINWSRERYAAQCEKIASFVKMSRSWRCQSGRLVEWLGNVLKSRRNP